MNKKHIFTLILIILFAVIQTSVFPHILILNNSPGVLMVFLLVFTYFRGNSEGMYAGLVGGFVLDVLVGNALGFYALVYMSVCFAMGFFPRKNIKDNVFITMALTMAFIFPAEIIIYILKKISIFISTGLEQISFNLMTYILKNVLPSILYDCIIFIPVYYMVRKFDGFLNKNKKLLI